MITKFTPEKIIEVEPMDFFVFGSNIQGEHVGGAALFAVNNFKAVNGQGFGIQGNAYAIPTCIRLWDNKCNRYTKPFDDVNQIKPFVDAFISDAKRFHYSTFFVTKIGCGIAGFKVSEVAELFRPCLDMENVILPKEFVECLLYPKVILAAKERGWECGKDYDDETLMDFIMSYIKEHTLDDMLDEWEREKNIKK